MDTHPNEVDNLNEALNSFFIVYFHLICFRLPFLRYCWIVKIFEVVMSNVEVVMSNVEVVMINVKAVMSRC